MDTAAAVAGEPRTRRRVWPAFGLLPGLIAVVVLASLSSGLLVGGLAQWRAGAAVQDQILKSNLAGASVSAKAVAAELHAAQGRTMDLARRPILLRAILNDQPALVEQELVRFIQSTSRLDSASVYGLDGSLYASSLPSSRQPAESLAEQDWFRAALTTDVPQLGPPAFHVDNTPAVPYAVPIEAPGAGLRAVLVADIPLSGFSTLMEELQTSPSQRVAIVDRRNAIVVAHADQSQLRSVLSATSPATRLALTGEGRASRTSDATGQPALAATVPVEDSPWSVLTEEPAQHAFAPLTQLTGHLLLGMATLPLVMAAVGTVLAFHITRPLARLRRATRAIAGGDLSHRVRLGRHDEIGELGHAFDTMAEALSERTAALEAANTRLDQQVEERTAALEAANAQLDAALQQSRSLVATVQGQADRLSLLVDFGRAATSTLDLDSIFTLFVQQVPVVIGAAWCSIARYEAAAGGFHIAAVSGSETLLRTFERGTFLPAARYPSGIALRRGTTVVINDLSRGEHEGSRRPTDRQGSMVSTPVTIDGVVWGTLNFGFDEPGAATPERADFAGALATHLAVAIKNAQLYGELHVTLEELKATQQRVIQQERLGALGQMASGIAHDVNNALVPVVGFSELLLLHPEDLAQTSKAQEYLRLIYTGARDAASVISRLREFYRERGPNEPQAPVALAALVRQAISLTQPKWRDQAQATGSTITIGTDLPQVPPIMGDEADLREMLVNLIFNATDAMPEGGRLTLRLVPGRVPGTTTLEVRDTGVGMTEEVRQRCLEPFFSTKGESGTGLGLAMVHGIVRRHGATLSIRSHVGQGTTFQIDFPAYDQTALATKPPPAATPGPLRVLVVDDDPTVCAVTSAYLEGDGHTAVTALSGREAIDTFRQQDFDLVLTDRAMPGMGGDQLATVFKQMDPAVPVVMLTGFGRLMTEEERPAGTDGLLGKPVDLEELRAVLSLVTYNGHGRPHRRK
jgi:signal transduction histidine kinase/ActR/RegA family two-component response regulator